MHVPSNALTSHGATQKFSTGQIETLCLQSKDEKQKSGKKMNSTTGNSPQRHLKTIATAVVRHHKFPSDTHLLKQ